MPSQRRLCFLKFVCDQFSASLTLSGDPSQLIMTFGYPRRARGPPDHNSPL